MNRLYSRGRRPYVVCQSNSSQTTVSTAAKNFRIAEKRVAPTGQQMTSLLRPPPCKKMTCGKPAAQDTHKVSEPGWNPDVQVDMMSPREPHESPPGSTKEALLSQFLCVHRQIVETESQVVKLKEKAELEEAGAQTKNNMEGRSSASNSIIPSWAQSLYEENRKKAYQAHSVLKKFVPKVECPPYNQPTDTGVYHENKLKYNDFKLKLVGHFKTNLKKVKEGRESPRTTTHAELSSKSPNLKNLEPVTKTPVKKVEEEVTVDTLLLKQRNEVAKFTGVPLENPDLEEPEDNYDVAVIPPILTKEMDRRIVDKNGLIKHPELEHRNKVEVLNGWTDNEKNIFKKAHKKYKKNFRAISTCLEGKSILECVQYYYLTKEKKYKTQILKENRAPKRSSRNSQHNTRTSASKPVPEPNRVTRGRRQPKMPKLEIQPVETASNGRGLTVLGDLSKEIM